MSNPIDLLNMDAEQLAQGTPAANQAPAAPAQPAAPTAPAQGLTGTAHELGAGAGMGAGNVSDGSGAMPSGKDIQPQPYSWAPMPTVPAFKPQPTAPAMQQVNNPALAQMPELKSFHDPIQAPRAATPMERAAADTSYKTPHSIIDDLMLGIGGGAVKVGAQGQALANLLSGHIEKNANQDWQRQYEAGIPADWRKSGGYQVGQGIGEMGAYAGTGVAAATTAAAAGFAAPEVAGAAMAVSALQGGLGGGAQYAQEQQYKGQKPKLGEAALAVGFGAAAGAAGGALGVGLQKGAVGYFRKRALNRALSKRAESLAKRTARDQAIADNLVDDVEDEIIQQQAQQVAAAHEALKYDGPSNPIANKQAEEMNILHAAANLEEDLYNLTKTKTIEEYNALGKSIQKRMPFLTKEQIIEAAKRVAKQRKANGGKPTTPPPTVAPSGITPGTQGPTRAPLVRKGYEAIQNATPLDDVLAKLPPVIARQYKAAIEELGEIRALEGHLENQVETYASNAWNLAKNAKQRERLIRDTKPKLKSGPAQDVSKARAEAHELQGQAKFELENKITDTQNKMRGATRGERRQLTDELNKLNVMLQQFPKTPLLKISTEKNIHVLADPHHLGTQMAKPADTYAAAFKQAEAAQNLLNNATKHLNSVRDKHLELFQQVEDLLGGRVAVRTTAQNFHPNYQGSTEMSVHLQWDPSLAPLIDRWEEKFLKDKAAIEDIITNYNSHLAHRVASNSRTYAAAAQKLLKDAGLVHPTAKGILAAGTLGINALLNPTPANAGELADMPDDERERVMKGYIAGGGAVAAMGALVLYHKFGPYGAKVVAASGRALCGALFEDTAQLVGAADKALASFRGQAELAVEESLAPAINHWRGKLMQRGFVCQDNHELLAKVMNGLATDAEKALVTPEGHAYLNSVAEAEHETKKFLTGYVRDWNKYMNSLSGIDKAGNREIDAAVKFVDTVLGSQGANQPSGLLDKGIGMAASAFARYHFSWNFKIASAGLIHDTLALGGLQLGPGACYAATFQHMTDPILRGLVKRLEVAGSHSEIRGAMTKAGTVKSFAVEKLQNEIVFLASLNRQYNLMSRLERQSLGVKDSRDFATKAMQLKLPEDALDRIYAAAGLDCAKVTGADMLGVNRSALERGAKVSKIFAYGRVPMAEQALWKSNVQAVYTLAQKGDVAGAVQRMAWMGHALLVKQQFGGARGMLPQTWQAAAQSFPITAEITAQFATTMNNYSLGVSLWGDNSAVRWDPIASPALATITPGLDNTLKMIGDAVTGVGDIAAAANVLTNRGLAVDEPDQAADHLATGAGELLTGSKQDEVIARGQKALVNGMSTAGLLLAQVAGAPIRLGVQAVQYFPDIVNAEQMIGARSIAPINSQYPVEPKTLYQYDPKGEQTQDDADAESRIDSIKKLVTGNVQKRELNAEIAKQLMKTSGKDNEVAQQLLEEAGLSKK